MKENELVVPQKCKDLSQGLSTSSIKKAYSAAFGRKIVRVYVEPDILVFLGSKEDHVLVGEFFCNCKDFQINVLLQKKRKACYHMLSTCIAGEKNKITHLPLSEVLVGLIVREIISNGKTITLRRIMKREAEYGKTEKKKTNTKKNG